MYDITNWEQAADAFGASIKDAHWPAALLVARFAKPGQSGRPPKSAQAEPVSDGKTSLDKFAVRATISAATVKRYFRTWEYAAEHKYGVASPGDLSPAEDYVLPGSLTEAQWAKAYKAANPSVFSEADAGDAKPKETKAARKSGKKSGAKGLPLAEAINAGKIAFTSTPVTAESFENEIQHMVDLADLIAKVDILPVTPGTTQAERIASLIDHEIAQLQLVKSRLLPPAEQQAA